MHTLIQNVQIIWISDDVYTHDICITHDVNTHSKRSSFLDLRWCVCTHYLYNTWYTHSFKTFNGSSYLDLKWYVLTLYLYNTWCTRALPVWHQRTHYLYAITPLLFSTTKALANCKLVCLKYEPPPHCNEICSASEDPRAHPTECGIYTCIYIYIYLFAYIYRTSARVFLGLGGLN